MLRRDDPVTSRGRGRMIQHCGPGATRVDLDGHHLPGEAGQLAWQGGAKSGAGADLPNGLIRLYVQSIQHGDHDRRRQR